MAARPYLTPPHTRAGDGLPPRALLWRRGAGLQNSHRCKVTNSRSLTQATNGYCSANQPPTAWAGRGMCFGVVTLRGAREAAYRHS